MAEFLDGVIALTVPFFDLLSLLFLVAVAINLYRWPWQSNFWAGVGEGVMDAICYGILGSFNASISLLVLAGPGDEAGFWWIVSLFLIHLYFLLRIITIIARIIPLRRQKTRT